MRAFRTPTASGRADWLVVGLLAAALALPLAAQESKPTKEFDDTIAVGEVLVDVLVTDNQGNVVLGLDENDFRVTENGKVVDLNDVTFYSNRSFLAEAGQAEKLGIDPDAVPSERYFILFFHDQRRLLPSLGAQQLEAASFAKRWVRESLLPNDAVAVAGFGYQLRLYQDFTRNADELAEAIDAAVISAEVSDREATDANAGLPSLAATLPTGKTLNRETPRIYAAIETLADAADGVRGRKNLVFFSLGFEDTGDTGGFVPDRRYYPDMVHALNDANVAVYTVNLLSTASAAGRASTPALESSLSQLADDTGGRYYRNFTNFGTPLGEVADDTNGYYLLSYTAPEGRQGYQQIEVEVLPRGLHARARDGYRRD